MVRSIIHLLLHTHINNMIPAGITQSVINVRKNCNIYNSLFCKDIKTQQVWISMCMTHRIKKLHGGGAVPQIDHDRNGPKTYTGTLLNHASFFEHQGHEHQSTEPALYLPG